MGTILEGVGQNPPSDPCPLSGVVAKIFFPEPMDPFASTEPPTIQSSAIPLAGVKMVAPEIYLLYLVISSCH